MAPTSRRRTRLMVGGGVLLAAVLVVGLFVLGLRVGQGGPGGGAGDGGADTTSGAGVGAGEAATAVPSETAVASETAAPGASGAPDAQPDPGVGALPPAPTAPAAAGEHPFTELFGGECLGAFASPWAETFTVVDCAAEHPAQLTQRGLFPEAAGTAYPGEAALASRLNLLCTAPTALNTAAVPDVADLRWQASFPATAEAWDAGDRVFQCFFSTASGAPLTGSLVP
ncbi:septum formation family protein [Herbiconiux sp. VKM Ac-1786]|uniref:septum formation family protein n=1 Tax=Herbiconiux sp. VKM Ac-1786 TaxID=2783824 RepID=UPI00188A87CF|nr:septum formation family protein [Herbiconiux sp. VKM Ac-1786]MBF4572362.1 septum formation family protein [Herbiconiux sp. VKM Ac-1786]